MGALLERINEWGYGLQQILEAQLQTGSVGAILVVFAAGLLTSLTPCVYPMIPVTVAFIGGAAGGQRKRAVSLSVIYVLGMAMVYSGLGVLAATAGLTFGKFTQTPWVYGAVGAVIVLFGLVMLEVVSIPMPGFFSGVQAQGARRGGHFGAFLMGIAAGFVAAPCTAPVLGALLAYVATTGHVLWGGGLLLVFALGLGFLLMILGIFSGMLSSLPKPGVWMEWVKRGFGIGMLAVGAWFFYKTVWMVLQRSA